MNWTIFAKANASGGIAGVLSAAALAICGHLELRDPWAPLNGPSQWVFGTSAARKRGFRAKYTIPGYLVHHAASVFWGLVFERLRSRRGRSLAAPAATTAALACLVDYQLTPRRLRPGFERRLSRGSLAIVYAAFAVGLAAGAALYAKSR